MRLKLLALIVLLLLPTPRLFAQGVTNPTTLTFTPSVDDAKVDTYEAGYFASPTATAPVTTVAVPKPGSCPVVNGTTVCSGPIPARPTGFATWYVGMRAVGAGKVGEWSSPLFPFERVPLPPTAVAVR